MRENYKRQETKIIGIAGAKPRHGCTHLAINMAAGLHALGFKVAVMEDSKTDTFCAIEEECPCKNDVKDGFSYLGVDYFPYKRPRVLPKLMGRGYDFIIVDHGPFSQCDKDFFYSCQPAIIACAGRPWEISDIDEVFEAIEDEEILKGLFYCFHFVSDKLTKKKISLEMGELKNVYFTKLAKNPFSDTDTGLIQRLLGLELKESVEENKAAFSLRPKIPFLFGTVSKIQKNPEKPKVPLVMPQKEPVVAELEIQESEEKLDKPVVRNSIEETIADAANEKPEEVDAENLSLEKLEEIVLEREEMSVVDSAAESKNIDESDKCEQSNKEVSIIVEEGELLLERDETLMETEAVSLPKESIAMEHQEEILSLSENEVIPESELTKKDIEPQPSLEKDADSKSCQDTIELKSQNPIKEEFIFGKYKKEGRNNPHAETEQYKYLDTMWFQHCIITCSPQNAYMPETFEFYIYPIALEKERIPMMTAVGMLHKAEKKTYFSTENTRSVKIEYEEYTFLCTVRFVDGKMVSRIALDSDKYKIIENKTKNYRSKNWIPQTFGKVQYFGNDRLEIYPLSLQNEVLSGCCRFMYRFQLENKDVTSGVSDEEDSIIIVPNMGGAKRVSCYWIGEGVEKKLCVLLS